MSPNTRLYTLWVFKGTGAELIAELNNGRSMLPPTLFTTLFVYSSKEPGTLVVCDEYMKEDVKDLLSVGQSSCSFVERSPNGRWGFVGGYSRQRFTGQGTNQQQLPKEMSADGKRILDAFKTPHPAPQWEEGINMKTGEKDDE